MRIPDEILRDYPDTTFPTAQCRHWRSLCHGCGDKYQSGERECRKCRRPRQRCARHLLDGSDDHCWVHSKDGGGVNLYGVVAGRIGDISFEDVLARDDRSVAQEFNLARWAVMGMASAEHEEDRPGHEQVLDAVDKFMRIARTRKELEDGLNLSIKVDDETAVEIRKQVSRVIKAFAGAMDESITDVELRTRILTRARELMHQTSQEQGIVDAPVVSLASPADRKREELATHAAVNFKLDGDLDS